MTTAFSPRLVMGLGLAGLAGLAPAIGSSGPGARPTLLINESPSAPRGLYLRSDDREPRLGRRVTIAQPPRARPYLAGLGAPPALRLLKRVVAVGGEAVCVAGGALRTPRETVRVLAKDRRGATMTAWRGCRRLAADELLLLGDTAASFDSRYFGPVRRGDVVAVYEEVLTW